MREIILDTETTGFKPDEGHRIVEIGCIELQNRMPTGATYHQYINPQRDMPEGAFKVHGLTEKFLSDKPLFLTICDAFLDFIGDAPIVAHNASFDMTFLNAELKGAKRPPFEPGRSIDTLAIARKKYPGAQNSLDALCRRFDVDNSGRELHGALIDADLLAMVYLELTGGRQPGLVLEANATRQSDDEVVAIRQPVRARPTPLNARLSPAESDLHTAFVGAELGEHSMWRKVQ